MKIIKDKQIMDDSWTHLADNDEISDGKITVSFSRWQKEKTNLSNRKETIGVRLSPLDKVEDLSGDLNQIPLVALEFPVFTDGRPFSQARLLRSRHNFKGEIRAIGNFMPDQVFYLTRVGVDAFQFDQPEDLNTALSTMNDFTVKYQASTN